MYRHLDGLVVRAAVCTRDDEPGRWPDLNDSDSNPAAWRPWLQRALSAPAFSVALEYASPVLAERVRAICDGRVVDSRAVHRVVMSVMRYLLRASGRATPYGLFAGVAPASLGFTAAIRIGSGHRAVARVRAEWLTAVVDQLEADADLRSHLTVRANNLLVRRGGHVVLEHRASHRPGDGPTHVYVRATGPVRAALALAGDPIILGDLVAKLATDFNVASDTVHALLANMVSQRLLLTNLRPPITATDPLAFVTARLREALPDPDGDCGTHGHRTLGALRAAAEQVTRHNIAPSRAAASEQRNQLASTLTAVHHIGGPGVAVDLRMDIDLHVPDMVAVEAAKAAEVLVRLAARGNGGWAAWHSRFLERFGPHALVRVQEAVDPDVGLGYPAGFLGAPPAPPGALTHRDRTLLALAQTAALRRQHEVVLDETMLRDLASEDRGTHVQPSTELIVAVRARSTEELQRGAFRLAIIGASRNAGTTTGRFLDLFDPTDRERIATRYAAIPTATRDALLAQISAATPYTVTEDVARSPLVMPHAMSLGEYHDNGPGRIALEDLAVTADRDRLYLVSLSRRRAVEPIVLNAVDQVHFTLPIVRFLAEAPTAFSTRCVTFDWGAAADLPFLPALRYGRTILSPARWVLPAADLPARSWQEWKLALTSWLDAVGCPQSVYLGEGDQRIGLDLTEPAHQALLRDHLSRKDTALLRAAPPADAAGWIAGRAHEIVVPLVSTITPAPPPRLPADARPVDVREHGLMPGCGDRVYVKLYGHPDRHDIILTRHLPSLLDRFHAPDRWWFLRYADPEPHLRLRLVDAGDTEVVAEWVKELRRAGLVARVQLDTDFPETARFGGPAALEAAEEVFAADSAAALAQLTTTGRGQQAPDARAVTAASLLDITAAVIGDTTGAMRWLIEHTRPHQPAPPRDIYHQAVRLGSPDRSALVLLPGGEALQSSWRQRQETLVSYCDVLRSAAIDPVSVLPDLLHLHHTRVVGPDSDSERACLHLARAAALSWTARARSRG